MEFWKRLNIASMITLGVTLASAASRWCWTRRRGRTSRWSPSAAWLAVGVVSAAGLAALTLFGERLVGDRALVERYRAVLVVANIVWIAGLVATTGGAERPYWALMSAPLLIAAVSMNRVRSLLIGVIATIATVIAVRASGPIGLEDAGFLVLVLPLGPGVTWFVGLLCAAVWDERRTAGEERDELSARVDELSSVLAQAAEGDLAVRVDARESANESVRALTESFNNTLLNLRQLVEQIRSGGDQITSSAGELLATAEEHAASATQQSSAVAETTSTIEELAATAAQIADTAESVARYAAETLRHAEHGRTAVATSVDSMDAIADRVDSIATRALSLGEKSQEIGRILERHRRPGRPDQPARAQRRHRGRARRRARPRLRRRRLRGAQARRALAGVGRPDPGDRHRDPGRDQRHDPRQRGGRQGGPAAAPPWPATSSTRSSASPAWSTRPPPRPRRSPSPPSSSGRPPTRSCRR